jgi:hypothetical protein
MSTSGARFTFNCYKHWSTLVIRDNDGTGTFLSKEGVTQGDPFNVCLWYRTITTHSCSQVQFPEMDQTWYADDAGGGKFDAIKRHFES